MFKQAGLHIIPNTYPLHSLQRRKFEHPPEDVSRQRKLIIVRLGLVGFVSQVVLHDDRF